MSGVFRVRLVLDLVAVGLIIACLAYWWRDNLFHEVLGTILFLLVIIHNVFNRRWYGTVAKRKFDAVRVINLGTIFSLATAVLIMLVSSFLISRDLFPFMALDAALAVREIHMFTAYWVLLIVAIHLGTRWTVIMNLVRGMLCIEGRNLARTIAARSGAAIIAIWGARSFSEMAFGSKLMLTYSLDMWNFSESTIGFFINYVSIVGLIVSLTHYLLLPAASTRRVIDPDAH